MTLPLIFSKFKTLAPVAVVAGAVAVTIKLLTQESTPTSQLLQVKAEEDILSPEFEEKLEEPQPEPAPPEPKEAEEEEVADVEEEEADDESSEQEGNSESESEPKENQEQSQQEEKDEKKSEARSIKPSEISDVLTALLKD